MTLQGRRESCVALATVFMNGDSTPTDDRYGTCTKNVLGPSLETRETSRTGALFAAWSNMGTATPREFALSDVPAGHAHTLSPIVAFMQTMRTERPVGGAPAAPAGRRRLRSPRLNLKGTIVLERSSLGASRTWRRCGRRGEGAACRMALLRPCTRRACCSSANGIIPAARHTAQRHVGGGEGVGNERQRTWYFVPQPGDAHLTQGPEEEGRPQGQPRRLTELGAADGIPAGLAQGFQLTAGPCGGARVAGTGGGADAGAAGKVGVLPIVAGGKENGTATPQSISTAAQSARKEGRLLRCVSSSTMRSWRTALVPDLGRRKWLRTAWSVGTRARPRFCRVVCSTAESSIGSQYRCTLESKVCTVDSRM